MTELRVIELLDGKSSLVMTALRRASFINKIYVVMTELRREEAASPHSVGFGDPTPRRPNTTKKTQHHEKDPAPRENLPSQHVMNVLILKSPSQHVMNVLILKSPSQHVIP